VASRSRVNFCSTGLSCKSQQRVENRPVIFLIQASFSFIKKCIFKVRFRTEFYFFSESVPFGVYQIVQNGSEIRILLRRDWFRENSKRLTHGEIRIHLRRYIRKQFADLWFWETYSNRRHWLDNFLCSSRTAIYMTPHIRYSHGITQRYTWHLAEVNSCKHPALFLYKYQPL
jgi:hypothetical protein